MVANRYRYYCCCLITEIPKENEIILLLCIWRETLDHHVLLIVSAILFNLEFFLYHDSKFVVLTIQLELISLTMLGCVLRKQFLVHSLSGLCIRDNKLFLQEN